MTGANYMGGKRNAAKARSRDSTGRIQRGFFGRQRLNILSKGIPCRTPASPTGQKPIVPMIELAHAPLGLRDLGTRERMDGKSPENRTTTFVTVPKTPESRRSKESSSSGTARSRVLDVLDTKEPMFLRATLNRILTLPDLAGLSGTSYASKRPRAEEDGTCYARNECKRKKTSPSNDNPHLQLTSPSPIVSSPCVPGTLVKGNRGRAITNSTGDGLHAPPEEDEESPDYLQLRPMSSISHSSRLNHSRGVALGVSSLPPSSEQASSSDLAGTAATGTAMDFEDQDWDDSGVDLDFERHHWTPSPQEEYGQSPTRGIVGVPSQHDDDDEIVSFDGSPRRCPRFTENNLYEHQDPWHTIGVILGLSPVRPDDRLLDGASEEQNGSFVKSTRSLSENENQHDLGMNEDLLSEDEGTTQLNAPPFWVAENDNDIDEDPMSDAQGSRCVSQQSSPLLLPAQDDLEDPEEQAHDPQITTTDINFEALSRANLSPGSVQAPSPANEPQSPFRILLESKRKTISSVNNSSSGSGSSATAQSSSSCSQSSLAPRTPSPRGAEETQSPFRMLLAARNRQKEINLNLTDYSLGDSVPSSSPGTMTFDFASSTMLKKVDGVFQGPCLFPDDASDDE